MKRSEIMAGALTLVCQMGIVGVFFSLSYIQNNFISMRIDYLWLTVAALAVYLVNVFLLQRGVPLAAFVVLQAVFAAAGLWLWTRLVGVEQHRAWTIISTGLLYCIQIISGAVFAHSPVSERGAALRFDLLCAASVFLLFLRGFMTIPVADETAVMCVISALSGLFSLIAITSTHAGDGGTAQGNALGGKIFVGVSLGVIISAALLVSAYFMRAIQGLSGAAAAVVKWCADAVLAVLTAIYGALYRLLRPIAENVDTPDAGPMAGESVQQMQGADFDYSELELQLPSYVYVIAAVIALAVFALIVWGMRKLYVSNMRAVMLKSARVRREKGEKGEMKRLLADAKKTVLYFYRRVRYRRTAAGLLDCCIRRAGKDTLRRTNESGEEYLRRLAQSGYGSELCAALESLAASVEKAFYSPYDTAVSPEVCKTILSKKSWKKGTVSS